MTFQKVEEEEEQEELAYLKSTMSCQNPLVLIYL
jgi:hypothetical protein